MSAGDMNTDRLLQQIMDEWRRTEEHFRHMARMAQPLEGALQVSEGHFRHMAQLWKDADEQWGDRVRDLLELEKLNARLDLNRQISQKYADADLMLRPFRALARAIRQEAECLEALLQTAGAHPRQAGQEKHSVLELRGLGKEIWEGIDPQEYVDGERTSWGG